MEGKDLYIRSSSAEFLIFERQTHASSGIEVRFEDGDLWLTQKSLAKLYDCSSDNIGLHLKNIYNDLELDKNSTTEKFSVGYRVSTDRAIQFRKNLSNGCKEYL